jgi:phosphotransferase system IIA component
VDFAAIKAAGFEIWTPVILTNMDAVSNMRITEGPAEEGKTAIIVYQK